MAKNKDKAEDFKISEDLIPGSEAKAATPEASLPHSAIGMFKDTDGMYKLMIFNYDAAGNTKLESKSNLNENRNIARDMFKVKVIERKLFQ